MNLEYAVEVHGHLKTMSTWRLSLMKAHGRKIYIGHEQREGWTGKLPFYLFWCETCEHFSKDYPHGHIERQCLICSNCGIKHAFVPWWMPWLELWHGIRLVIRYRTRGL